MVPQVLRLNVAIGLGDDASDEERDEAARLLRDELQDAAVGEVDLAAAGQPPDGTKSAEAFIAGALTLTLLPTMAATALAVLKDWANRRPGRTLQFEYGSGPQRVKLEYDPDRTDVSQLLALVLQPSHGAGDVAVPASPGLTIGGDVVGGDKTIHTEAGGDVVGRDKVTTIHVAPGSTLIVNDPTLGIIKAAPLPGEAPLPAD